MEDINRILSKANIATSIVVIFFLVGAVKVVAGDIEFNNLISLMAVPTAGLAVGRGLAAVDLPQAPAAIPAVAVATILVLAYAVLGGVQVVVDNLTFEAYLKSMDVPLAGLAIGRGIAANNTQ